MLSEIFVCVQCLFIHVSICCWETPPAIPPTPHCVFSSVNYFVSLTTGKSVQRQHIIELVDFCFVTIICVSVIPLENLYSINILLNWLISALLSLYVCVDIQ